ncbi:MAG: 4'-phosphopantetheinyl transferase superfamily protein [Planctomycetes bacterium]|nr:4'-phosphopantetheinyl transferase superfamily protein [Planctomycetota bacterium]
MDEVALDPAFVAVRPEHRELGNGRVHVWAVPLAGDPEPYLAPLSAGERVRAGRFHFADHRRRFEITHGALRHVLASYVGKEPAALEFRVGPRGKPYLAGDGAPQFSLSHSGKLTMIAVAMPELGLDCEKVRHLESYREIAEKHFSPVEFEELERLGDGERLLAFYRCWTRKEAYIKALGEGLTMGLDTFDVSIDAEPRFLACRDGRSQACEWSMVDVSPATDFVAAVALKGAMPGVERFRLQLG